MSEDFASSENRVAPLIQPNYAALRAYSNLLKHDALEPLSFSSTKLKAQFNTRFVDVARGDTYRQRVDVYLTWCLPRLYRARSTATDLLNNDKAVYENEKILLRGGFISRIGEDDTVEPSKLKVSHLPRVSRLALNQNLTVPFSFTML